VAGAGSGRSRRSRVADRASWAQGESGRKGESTSGTGRDEEDERNARSQRGGGGLAWEGMGASLRRWRRQGTTDGEGVRALMRVANTSAGVVGRLKRRDRDIVREEY
jgi:hypothetical protein